MNLTCPIAWGGPALPAGVRIIPPLRLPPAGDKPAVPCAQCPGVGWPERGEGEAQNS